MPLRLPVLPIHGHTCRIPYRHVSRLHTLPPLQADTPNHYETLGIEPDASQSSIKKQFYTLSKLHHPDRNPSDPHASTRFVAISDAYATLSSPTKRTAYDRESGHGTGSRHSSSPHPPSSYSSAAHRANDSSGAWGARPASGLSKKRGTFRGPPPSFYRSGGWGAQGEKRGAAASASTAGGGGDGMGGQDTNGRPSTAGGFSPGQGESRGLDDDVPHFDRREHFRRQEAEDERGRRKRRIDQDRADREREALERDNALVRVLLVGGVLGLALLMPQPWRGAGTAAPSSTAAQVQKKRGRE